MPRVNVRVNLQQSERIQRLLAQLPPTRRGNLADRVLRDITKLGVGEARQQIVTGRGEDPKKAPPLPRRLTFRTGFLTRSIGRDLSQAPARYIVGASARYAPVHELGLGRYPERPFLRPGVEKAIKENLYPLFRKYFARLR